MRPTWLFFLGLCACVQPIVTPTPVGDPAADWLSVLVDVPDETRAVVDLDDGLSPDEGALWALAHHPALVTARDDAWRADYDVVVAGLLPRPTFGVGVEVPLNDSNEQVGGSAEVGWDVTAGRGRADRTRSAESTAESVRLDLAWTEWQVATEARQAVLDVAQLDAQRALVAATLEAAVARQDELHAVVDQGLALQEAAYAIDDIVAAWRIRGVEVDAALGEARATMSEALGGIDPQVTVSAPAGATLDPPSESSLVAALPDRRLDLIALDRLTMARDADVAAAMAQRFPTWELTVGAAQDTAGLQTATVGVSVTPVDNATRVAVDVAGFERDAQQRRYEARLVEAERQVRVLYAQWHAASAEAQAAEVEADRLEARWLEREAELRSHFVARPTALDDLAGWWEAEWTALLARQAVATRRAALEQVSGHLFEPMETSR